MNNEKHSEKLSDSFLHDSQKSKYLAVPQIFRKTSSEQRSLLASDATRSTDTRTKTPWSDVLARSVSAEEASVYENLEFRRKD